MRIVLNRLKPLRQWVQKTALASPDSGAGVTVAKVIDNFNWECNHELNFNPTYGIVSTISTMKMNVNTVDQVIMTM